MLFRSRPETCIDPLEMIKEVGADAVRLSLVIGTSPGNPIPLGKEKITGYRNFVNKLWNAGRFVKMQISDSQVRTPKSSNFVPKSLADKWILSRLTKITDEVSKHLEKYEISASGDKIYHFVWDEFCDWYIEANKVEKNPGFLRYIFLEILKLTHPLCPFISEKLWEELANKDQLLIEQSFPILDSKDAKAEEIFERVQSIVTEIRRLRADKKLNPKEKLSAVIPSSADKETSQLIENLAGVKFDKMSTKGAAKIVVENLEVFVQIPVNENRQKAEIKKLEAQIQALEGRLSNKSYTGKAPAFLVKQTKKELAEAKEKLKKMKTF